MWGRLLMGTLLVVMGVLIAPVATFGAPAGSSLVDLGPGWERATPEDAAAGRWEPVTLPDRELRTAHRGDEVRLYRATVEVPPELRGQALGLTLGFGGTSYRLSIDGEDAGGAGVLSRDGRFRPPERLVNVVHRVPRGAAADGRLVLELTSELERYVYDGTLTRGVRLLGPVETVTYAARLSDHRYWTDHILIALVPSSFLLAVALWHLGLWRRRRELVRYAFYALYAASLAVAMVPLGLFRARPDLVGERLHQQLFVLGMALAVVFGVEFVHRLVQKRPAGAGWRWIQGGALVCAALAVVGCFGYVLTPALLARPLMLAALVLPLSVAVGPALRGNRDGWLILSGLGVAFVMVGGPVIASWMGLLDFKEAAAELSVALTPAVLVGMMAVALADNYTRDLARLDATREAALRFVPGEFLRTLGRRNVTDAERGDSASIEATVMFSDIRGFTTLSEQLSAEETFGLVNRYLGVMQPVIHAHGGIVASYLGDGIMAVFPGGPEDALRSAGEQVRALAALNRELDAPLAVGFGFHHGPLMLGTLGGPDHLECTLIGDTVNVAARVEGMTKQYGATVLCTESVVEALGDASGLTLRELDRVQLKGKAERVALFEVAVG